MLLIVEDASFTDKRPNLHPAKDKDKTAKKANNFPFFILIRPLSYDLILFCICMIFNEYPSTIMLIEPYMGDWLSF